MHILHISNSKMNIMHKLKYKTDEMTIDDDENYYCN